ncbi:MAG: hypothetical protein Q8K00_08355 [Syntrophales bacterium]|nr:hypothetical protein [Syntrophales bacterium]
MSTDIATIGIRVDSTQVVTASRDLAGLEGKAKTVEQELGALAKKSTDSGREVQTATQSMSVGFDKLRGVVATLATSYALLKTAQYIQEVAGLAARYETLGISMEMVGKNAFYTKGEMDAAATGMQRLGISMIESRQQAMRMVQGQLDLNQSSKLARIAQDAAVIGNINSSEAFARMIQGIRSGETEILKNIGLQVNMEQAYRKFEQTNRLATGAISESQKVQARANAVVAEGAKIAGVYEAAMGTAGKQITSFPRYLEDFKVKMGEAFNPATTALVGAATDVMKKLQDEVSKPEAQAALAALGKEFSTLAISAGKELPGALNTAAKALTDLIAVANSLPEGGKGAVGVGIIGRLLFGTTPAGVLLGSLYLINEELKKMGFGVDAVVGKSLDQRVLDLQKAMGVQPALTGPFQGGSSGAVSGAGATWSDPAIEGQRKRDEIAKTAAAEAKAAADALQASKDLKKLRDEDRKGLLAGIQAQMDADDEYYTFLAKQTAKSLEDAEKTAEEKKAIAGSEYSYLFAQIDEWQAAEILAGEETIKAAEKAAEEKKKLAEQLPGMYRDVYSDIRGYENEAFEASMILIKQQAEAYKLAGMDQVVIAKWVAEETKSAALVKAAAEEDFFAGWKAGMQKAVDDEKTFGQLGIELAKEVHDAKEGFIKTGVEAFIKGENAKIAIQEYAGNLITDIASKYSTKMYEAAIEKIVSIIGAYIGQGAAGAAAGAAGGGGTVAAIGEVALYLAGAVGAMLGGKALASQFKAEGGWIANHPDGGFINAGSGYRDDVYLGRTENARHWGMGGEFVVNKDASREYASLLQAINGGYLNTVSDRRFADGGWVGDNGQALVGDPDNLAERMAAGGWLCFAAGMGQAMAGGADLYAGIAAGIAADVGYIVSAAGGALGGKALGDQFKATGGPIQDVGHGWLTSLLPPSWQHLNQIRKGQSPGPVSVPVIPGIMNFEPATLFDNNNSASIESWLEDAWRSFMDTQRAGWRNYAEVVLEPGNNSMDVIGALGHELDHFYKHILKTAGLLIKPPGHTWAWEDPGDEEKARGGWISARNGLDYVPYDNMPILAHQGERVQTASEVNSLGNKMDKLTATVEKTSFYVIKNTEKTAKLLQKFDAIGLPARDN